jgi:hypothetical protein
MISEDLPLKTTTGEKAGEVVAIALNAVPIAGGVMSDIAGAIISKRQNRRLNQFLVTLADNLKSLESRVNEDFLRTEEFQDLAEDIFSKAAETRQQEKLDAFRAILVNTVLSDSPTYDEAAEIADLVNGWQPRHIILMHILADPVAADQKMGNAVGPGGGLTTSISTILHKLLPEWDDDQIDRTWKELYDVQMHRTPGTKTMMTDQGINQLQNRLTDFGVKVARYLSLPE